MTSQEVSGSVWSPAVEKLYQQFVEENPAFDSITRRPDVAKVIKSFLGENREFVNAESELRKRLTDAGVPNESLINRLVEFKQKAKKTEYTASAAVMSSSSSTAKAGINTPSDVTAHAHDEADPITSSATIGTAGEIVDAAAVGGIPEEYTPLPRSVDGFLRLLLGLYDAGMDYKNPGPMYDMAVHDSEAVRLQTLTGYSASTLDSESFVDQIAGAGGEESHMLRSFGGMVPQVLAFLDNPRVQTMLETIEPGTADIVKTVVNAITGGKGSARELNRVLNSGRYGEAAAQDMLSIVKEFRDRTTMKIGPDGHPNNPTYTMGQLALTAKYAKETLGITPEVVFGSKDAKNKIGVLKQMWTNWEDGSIADFEVLQNQFKSTLKEGEAYNSENFYKALVYQPQLFTKTPEAKQAYQSLIKQVQERAKDSEKTDAGLAYYERLTENMRLVGNAAMSIITPEERAAFLKQAKGSEHDAAVLAAQHYMSMYGNAGLRRGDMDLATQQASYILNSAHWAGLNTKALQEHAATIYKAFGPDKATQATAAIMGSLSAQSTLEDAGILLTDNMRVQIEQRHADAEFDPGSTRMAWFMMQKLGASADPEIKAIQEALKTGKNLTKDQLDRVSEWLENPSKFYADISSATGMSESDIASATSTAYSENTKAALTSAQQTSLNVATTAAKVNLYNQRNYTEEGAASAADAVGWDKRTLSNFGYTTTQDLASDFAKLGKIGADPVAVLSGQKELTDEQKAAYKALGGNVNKLESRLNRAKTRYNRIAKTHESENLSTEDLNKTVLNEMGSVRLQNMYTTITGNNYIAPEVELDNPDHWNTEAAQKRTRDEANTEANREKLKVRLSAVDAWSMARFYGLGRWLLQGFFEPPETQQAVKTREEALNQRIKDLSANPAVQVLSDSVTEFKKVVDGLVEAVKSATDKINGTPDQSSAGEAGDPNTDKPDTPVATDSTLGTTAEPESAPVTSQSSTEVSTEATQTKSDTFKLSSVSQEAADALGEAIANHITTVSLPMTYNPTVST